MGVIVDRIAANHALDVRQPYLWLFVCEVPGCYYRVACRTRDEAERERAGHRCPRRGVPMGPSIIQKAWAQLDEQVDEIMRLAASPDGRVESANALEVAKARARGKAEILALLMVPHFTTADEISLEAARRHQIRQAGGTLDTPGVDR